MRYLFILYSIFLTAGLSAQDKTLPYYDLPVQPEKYTAGNVASRLLDGLGFRFYWATEGLRSEDLSYRPNAEARTSLETIQHIYEMSIMVVNATTKTVNVPQNESLPFQAMRKRTLENLKLASERLRVATDQDINDFKAIFKKGESTIEFPFWNQLNGPIADCLWHTGQIVSLRRSSGNPFNENVNLFLGTITK